MTERPKGPLGIDPLYFSIFLFTLLMLFVFYLLLPRALRKQYFGAYPKRHAWSARTRSRRSGSAIAGGGSKSYAVRTLFLNFRRLSLPPAKYCVQSISSPMNLSLCFPTTVFSHGLLYGRFA